MAASLARQAANLARLSSYSSAVAASRSASLIHRRGLAGSAEHHGPPKVNFWKDPRNPGNWKEEHKPYSEQASLMISLALFLPYFEIHHLRSGRIHREGPAVHVSEWVKSRPPDWNGYGWGDWNRIHMEGPAVHVSEWVKSRRVLRNCYGWEKRQSEEERRGESQVQERTKVSGRAFEDLIRIATKFPEMENTYSSLKSLRYEVIVDVAPELKRIPDDGYKHLKIVVEIDKEIVVVTAAEQELRRRLKALVALKIVTSYAVVAYGLLDAAVALHLSVTNLSAARGDALESTVIRLREGFRRKEQNCSSSSSEGCGSSVKRSSSAEAGRLGNSAVSCTGGINCWNNVDGVHSENSMDSGRPTFALRSSCRSVVQESEVGPSSMGKNVDQNSSLVVCSSSGVENQGYESSASNSLNPALDLSSALAFQEKSNDPRITSILKRRAAHGELGFTNLLQDLVKKHSEFISYPIYLWTGRTTEKEFSDEEDDEIEKEEEGDIEEVDEEKEKDKGEKKKIKEIAQE
ncbi:hypothetical protein F511_17096 [Dorcoceras hygrometricum]|uniref:Uncharacterized protein n=1 Tax=Dorcoceras hygrometricum TaxID=472368 RepID=A0A2Z7AZS5_9LAMI|nr:hypothetical protein F511_17096 [Dorcoceras hygrometricum]